jgi:hypothetical protein
MALRFPTSSKSGFLMNSIIRRFVLACLIAVTGLVVPTLADDTEVLINGRPTTSKTWDAYTVFYPAGRWELQVKQEGEQRAFLELKPMGSNDIVLQVSLMRLEARNDPHYENNPQMFNHSVLLSPALELANNDESKIFMTAGQVVVPSGWYPSSRATVLMGENRAIHLEACHDCNLPTGHFVSVIIMTKSEAGQVNQDPAFTDKLLEAYGVIQMIRFTDPTTTPTAAQK